MIKIKTAELREFFKKTSHIRGATILAVYDYVKVEYNKGFAVLTKASESKFVRHKLNIDSQQQGVALLEWGMLKDAVDTAESPELEIKIVGKSVTISDGVTPTKFQQPEDVFPVLPTIPEEKIKTFSFDILEAIGVARKHARAKVVTSGKVASNFVHIKKIKSRDFCIWGMNDQHVIYFKKFKKDLLELQLDLDVCEVLSTVEEATYYKVNNWMLFECDSTLYGFAESERNTANIEMYTTRLPEAKKEFLINKHDLLAFCTKAISLHSGVSNLVAIVRMKRDSDAVKLVYNNKFHNREAERLVSVEWFDEMDGDFCFEANYVGQALRGLPFNELIFHRYKHGNTNLYFLTTPEDEDYIGLINGLSVEETPASDDSPFE